MFPQATSSGAPSGSARPLSGTAVQQPLPRGSCEAGPGVTSVRLLVAFAARKPTVALVKFSPQPGSLLWKCVSCEIRRMGLGSAMILSVQ